MAKLTIDDLKKIKEEYKEKTHLREGGYRVKITVHMGTCGLAAGSREIMDSLLDEIQKANVTDIIVTTSGCAGLCSREPMVTIEMMGEPPVKYGDLTDEKIRKIFREHVLEGKIVEEYAIVRGCETSY
ncbi:NADP-reducing hydrogenase subunit HndB [bacterium BMS3Abin07]|nr:NADP-reducing hydrogenase subunit HndB [bacterium BMS3Abin07]GBE32692.1 NADP-reducing hydrogenase subunit HndB [bacterium BMS3Bbin05]HDL21298.1 (2Fe-2S) ferredoxin domain-containing protein [Nitrospirota bacterium]HDZ88399.1 (2Fe-2S) ferredoxin domain-containing protein [Nitrospirota bacterium]